MADETECCKLDECKCELEAIKAKLAPTTAASADGATALDPTVILAIIDVVLKLIERFRNRS